MLRYLFLPLFVIFLLCLKTVGVFFTQSFALEAETLHSLLDVGLVFIGMVAFALGERERRMHPHRGYTRLELALTLVYSLLLLFFVFMLFRAVFLVIFGSHVEIFHDHHDHPVHYDSMRWFSLLNLSIEFILLYIIHRLSHHHAHTLVVRGLFWHLISDVGASVLTVVAAFWGYHTENPWIDVLLGLVIGSLLLRNALHLFFTSFVLAIGRGHSPLHTKALIASLKTLSPSIVDVHHIHVDRLSASTFSFTCHIALTHLDDAQHILDRAPDLLRKKFSIVHSNLQVEVSPCIDPSCLNNHG